MGELRAQFETCVGRLGNRDLIRRLSFGGYVLLQAELLDAYASAMVNAAKNEADGLGSIAEEDALAGRFFVPEEAKVKDKGQEQLLVHATVEELIQHDVALRETGENGRYLVFPSQFSRDYEDGPDPKGKAVGIGFDGAVQSVYATLAVRLGHSGLFETGRTEMWRNAAVYAARAGGKCGIYMREFAESRGQVTVFYDEASDETRFYFEEYVLSHVKRWAMEGSVVVTRWFVCPQCGNTVPEGYVKMLRGRGEQWFDCPCGGRVWIAEPRERLAKRYASKVESMDRAADRQRDFEAFVVSAKGETKTSSFVEWAGGKHVVLAIVFTDVVGSTKLGQELGDERFGEMRKAHFEQGRKLLGKYGGREIKMIGDSFMAAFKSAEEALDFAMGLKREPGDGQIRIRAGIHIGPLQVEGEDAFGGTVNFAARVVDAVKEEEIWVSQRVKEDIEQVGAGQHAGLQWEERGGIEMKGFKGRFTLWAMV